MQFTLTEEQQMIRDGAREFFAEHASSERVRRAVESDLGYEASTWRQIGELGWAGIAIEEEFGGAGLGMVELALLQHEQGRRLAPSPFFSTAGFAAQLIGRCATPDQKKRWLPGIASGGTRLAVALTGASGRVGLEGLGVELRGQGAGLSLAGEAHFVIHGHACDQMLVVARAAGSRGMDAVSLVLVEPQRRGLAIEKCTVMDLTRPMSVVRFEAVPVGAEDVLGEVGGAGAGCEHGIDLARIALAAEAVGGAEQVLEMTTGYVKNRVQFGRPIGSFQAVKHRLADMLVEVEAARSAVWYAACVAAELPGQLPEAASIAKAACCGAFFNCAANAVQLHGGIGFTWEHDAHLYFKRARAASTLLGSPAWQRERLATLIGLGESTATPAY